jgi:hypothetical protein
MRKLLMKLGKEFTTDIWSVVLSNATNTCSLSFVSGFEPTIPFPGNILEEEAIKQMIEFLQQTLEEKEDGQSNVE